MQNNIDEYEYKYDRGVTMKNICVKVLGKYNSWIDDFRDMKDKGCLYIESCNIIGLNLEQMSLIESTFNIHDFKFLENLISYYDIEGFSIYNDILCLDFLAINGISTIDFLNKEINRFQRFINMVMEKLEIVQEYEIILRLDFFDLYIDYSQDFKDKDDLDNITNPVKIYFEF